MFRGVQEETLNCFVLERLHCALPKPQQLKQVDNLQHRRILEFITNAVSRIFFEFVYIRAELSWTVPHTYAPLVIMCRSAWTNERCGRLVHPIHFLTPRVQISTKRATKPRSFSFALSPSKQMTRSTLNYDSKHFFISLSILYFIRIIRHFRKIAKSDY